MSLLKKSIFYSAVILGLSSSAFAAENKAGSSYLPPLNGNDITVKVDAGGIGYTYEDIHDSNYLGSSESRTKKTSKFVTSPADIGMSIYYQDWHIGMNFNGAGDVRSGEVSLGKRLDYMWDVGGFFNEDYYSVDNSSSSHETVSNYFLIGPYVLATIPTSSPKTFVEVKGKLGIGYTNEEYSGDDVGSDQKASGYYVKILGGATLAYYITKHFALIPEVYMAYSSGSLDYSGGPNTHTDSRTDFTFHLTPINVRLQF